MTPYRSIADRLPMNDQMSWSNSAIQRCQRIGLDRHRSVPATDPCRLDLPAIGHDD
jgi:hypothetical protein